MSGFVSAVNIFRQRAICHRHAQGADGGANHPGDESSSNLKEVRRKKPPHPGNGCDRQRQDDTLAALLDEITGASPSMW